MNGLAPTQNLLGTSKAFLKRQVATGLARTHLRLADNPAKVPPMHHGDWTGKITCSSLSQKVD